MIRCIRPDDMEEVKRLHALYFPENGFPDFLNYLCAYVVEDEKGIITIGGITDIVEAVTVTNKERSTKDKEHALREIMSASVEISRIFGYKELYAFVQDSRWHKRLQKVGFEPPDGQCLKLHL